MIEIVPLTKEIFDAMGKADHYPKITMPGARGLAMAIDGNPVAAAGLIKVFDDTAHAWTILLPEAKQSQRIMRRVHYAISTLFPLWCEELKLVRVQADTELDLPGGCAWLERLGFKFEGNMVKYCQGKDFARYAWVRG